MRAPSPPATPWHWAWAVAAPAAATAVGLALDRYMSVAGLAMVYLVATVAAALALPRAPGVLASLLCVSALNYFFVPPRHSFEVDGAEYWWTLAVLLGLSLALNQLITGLREGRAGAELGRARAAELHALSEALMECPGHEAMAARAAQWLGDALQRPCAVFLRGAPGQPPRCWGAPDEPAHFHARSAEWAMDHGRPLGRGCDDWPDLALWCAPFARHGASGALQVTLDGPGRPDAGTLAHWLALAQQVGLCVERARAFASAQAAEDSARAEAARNTLLAALSHDLRTPLAGIVGSASALRTQGQDMSPAQRERLLANLEDEARDLTLMADNILQMARLSQPHCQLDTEWESLEDILGAAVTRMRRRWPGQRLQLRVAPDLPPVRVEAGLLAQAVANLVDNALRHGGPAPVTIQAGRSRDGVFLAVRDQGPGLPAGDPAALFDRFHQGGDGRHGAAGLGLAICKLVAQAHGGRIEAHRCEPGTELRIDLPAAAPQGAAP